MLADVCLLMPDVPSYSDYTSTEQANDEAGLCMKPCNAHELSADVCPQLRSNMLIALCDGSEALEP